MRYFCWKIVKIAERWGLRPQIVSPPYHLKEKSFYCSVAAKADFDNDLSIGPPVFPKLKPNTDFTSLMTLVEINSSAIFSIFGVSYAWLKINVTEWEKSTEYQKGKQVFAHLKVTNDCAERNVKLITEYNDCLVTENKQRASVLQSV